MDNLVISLCNTQREQVWNKSFHILIFKDFFKYLNEVQKYPKDNTSTNTAVQASTT